MLYIIPTPIGNLEDMTFRAVRILSEVDIIACEDTRTSGVLLKHYDIKTPTISYHSHSWQTKVNKIKPRIIRVLVRFSLALSLEKLKFTPLFWAIALFPSWISGCLAIVDVAKYPLANIIQMKAVTEVPWFITVKLLNKNILQVYFII